MLDEGNVHENLAGLARLTRRKKGKGYALRTVYRIISYG